MLPRFFNSFFKIIKLFDEALKRLNAFLPHFISFINQDDKKKKTIVLTILAIIISITAHFILMLHDH